MRLKDSLRCLDRITYGIQGEFGDLIGDLLVGDWQRCYVPLHLIRNTQGTVTTVGLEHYLKRKRHTDSLGGIAWGIRFNDSQCVYLMNGHHRKRASEIKGRKKMWLDVQNFDLSLADLLRDAGCCEQTIRRALSVPQS